MPSPVRYLLAAGMVAVALTLRLWVAPPAAGLPFLTFFPATALAAILCGFGPGLLAATLGSGLAGFLFLPPLAQSDVTFWSQTVFLGDALLVCWAVDAMHRFQARYLEATGRLAAANVELSQANVRLEASNQDLEQFAYVASHDLQEPLRMVVSYGQLLDKRYRNALDADAGDFIGFMVEGANRMQAMVSDLLDFSRIERLGDRPQPFDSGEAVIEAMASLAMVVTEAKARISQGDLPTVTGDRAQFIRLMQNLVGNALKYRDPERSPAITITGRQEGGQVIFAVADNGIGVESQYFERIFRIFQRLHTRDQYGGTGIGLAVCKKIVERHGGRIWLDSDGLGKGATVTFTLPRPQA